MIEAIRNHYSGGDNAFVANESVWPKSGMGKTYYKHHPHEAPAGSGACFTKTVIELVNCMSSSSIFFVSKIYNLKNLFISVFSRNNIVPFFPIMHFVPFFPVPFFPVPFFPCAFFPGAIFSGAFFQATVCGMHAESDTGYMPMADCKITLFLRMA